MFTQMHISHTFWLDFLQKCCREQTLIISAFRHYFGVIFALIAPDGQKEIRDHRGGPGPPPGRHEPVGPGNHADWFCRPPPGCLMVVDSPCLGESMPFYDPEPWL